MTHHLDLDTLTLRKGSHEPKHRPTRRIDVGFAARDWAGIADPRKLQDARAKARTRARDEAIRRLIEAHRDEYDAIRERAFLEQHETFLRRLEATERVRRQREAAAS